MLHKVIFRIKNAINRLQLLTGTSDQNETDAYRCSIPGVDRLDDKYLGELNGILDWKCYTIDINGRKFGKPANASKRNQPQVIPDARIVKLHETINLSDKTVLEVGCFEGVHTIALCERASQVKAVDSRIENLAKTMVRLGFYQKHANVFRCDLEKVSTNDYDALSCDVLHHVGVLYHLSDPVGHLHHVSKFTRSAILLDTHYAADDEANREYETVHGTYKYRWYGEYGYHEVFSGMEDHSKWLRLKDIQQLLYSNGFTHQELWNNEKQRNGYRVALFARREDS